MKNKNILNLLVIDSNQLYAEHLLKQLADYYQDVHLGLLDDKEQFIKTLTRKQWDVAIYNQAYDMQLTDVLNIIEEQKVDLPVISLLNEETAEDGQNKQGFASVISDTLIKAISAEQEQQMILSIILHQQASVKLRTIRKLHRMISDGEQRANILIKNSKSAVAYIEEGFHIFANDTYLKLFGYKSIDNLLGVPVIDLFSSGTDVQEFKQFLKRFEKGSRDQVEFKFESKRADNSTFSAKLQLASATYEGRPVIQIIIQHDIELSETPTELAKKLALLQRTDALTGLENRYGFMEHLAKVRKMLKEKQSTAGLIYAHLDNLAEINSSLGIKGIDATVQQVADKLTAYFKDNHVSRFTDSTFTIIVEDTNKEELQKLAEESGKIVDDMIIEVGKRTSDTSLSIGLVELDANSPDVDTIMRRAFEAFNQVLEKTNKKGNSYHLYDPSHYLDNDADVLVEYLTSSLTKNNFSLVYQPIYDIETDSSNTFEVYTSLKLSDGKTMSYGQFYNIAKNNNLLNKIDRWILVNACKQLIKVRTEHPNAKIVVNLSSDMMIDEQLPQIAEKLIKALNNDANALILQFDEKDVIKYLAVAKRQFSALSALNCRVSMHSFGATEKSLEIVEFAKPNLVKLDRNRVMNVGDTEKLNALKKIISDVNEYHIDVLMAYIEDASTMSVAWSVGARYLQGYYLQPPSDEIHFD